MWKISKECLTSLFVSCLILSNILGAKVIVIGKVAIPGGIVCYALTCLLSDVIGERYGREQSRKVLMYGFVCQILCSCLIALTLALPAFDQNIGKAFDTTLKSSWWFTVASLTAYLISRSTDVIVFHNLRDRLIAKGSKHRWIWNKASTLISQALDTIVFIVIAFGLGLGFLFEPSTRQVMLQMMLWQYLIKAILAAIDTPFFYVMTKKEN